jgi:CTP:molybdopterin cytidylyltransferase MocA
VEASEPADRHTVALVLAAGAGTRMGRPKALVRDAGGTPWLDLATGTMLAAGCSDVIVVLGAGFEPDRSAETPRFPLPEGREGGIVESRHGLGEDQRVRVVVARDWAEGMSASLRAGLTAAAETEADAVLVTLVDLPHLAVEAATRVLALATGPDALARAVDDGRPAHPVLIGRAHWAPLVASLGGDRGAREYLRANGAVLVDVTGLGGGDDVDHPVG